MVMREEEGRYNRGLVHQTCQMLNKNKVAGRAPIPNNLQLRQTNTLKESSAGVEHGAGEKD